uniref:Uncharacterized protein n=1 Tax=Arundo donax TaxID=35708 RepID=A0A0A9FX74_ARUDO
MGPACMYIKSSKKNFVHHFWAICGSSYRSIGSSCTQVDIESRN